MTDRSKDEMERYHVLARAHVEAGDDLTLYLDQLQPIEKAVSRLSVAPAVQASDSTRRPIVIEHASEPSPVTPFRGEIAPPSAWQADLF